MSKEVGKKYGLHFISESALAKVWTSDNGIKRTTTTYPTLAVVGGEYAIRRHNLSSEVSVTQNSARVEEYRDLLVHLKTIAVEEEEKCPATRREGDRFIDRVVRKPTAVIYESVDTAVLTRDLWEASNVCGRNVRHHALPRTIEEAQLGQSRREMREFSRCYRREHMSSRE